MNYRVKVKGGVSVFHDKELAEKCAKKNKSKVEEAWPADLIKEINRKITNGS